MPDKPLIGNKRDQKGNKSVVEVNVVDDGESDPDFPKEQRGSTIVYDDLEDRLSELSNGKQTR